MLKDDRIVLYPIDEEALGEIYLNLINDTEGCLIAYNRIFSSNREFLDFFNNNYAAENSQIFRIYDLKTDTIIGFIGIDEIDYINRHCNLFIYIFKLYRQNRKNNYHRCIYRAFNIIALYVFNILRFNKIKYCCGGHNTAVKNISKRFGTRKSGIQLIESFSRFSGKYEHRYRYEVLKNDFKPVLFKKSPTGGNKNEITQIT